MTDHVHAPFAPSAAERWISCPGSVNQCKPIPDAGSAAAREGTFAHEIAAECLLEDVDAATKVGRSNHEFTFGDDDAAYIQEYLDEVRAIERVDGSKIAVEQKVVISEDVYGTADAVVLAENTLHVWDLKYGSGVWVDVVSNPQLMIYGLGALVKWQSMAARVTHVALHIVQPRHHNGGHSTWVISKSDLIHWGKTVLRDAVKQASDPDALLVPGTWCSKTFCRAQATCPALQSYSLERTRAIFSTIPDPEDVPDERLGELLEAFPTIEKWIAAVRAHAYALAESGRTVPGQKIVNKVGNRKWVDEDKVEEVLELLGYDPYVPPTVVPAKLMSPNQAEKLLGRKHKDLLEGLAEKPTVGSVLVPLSDPRPARNRAAVFDVLTDTNR